MQHLIIFIVLATAVTYAGWRIYRTLRAAGDPCYGCEGCQLKELRKRAKEQKGEKAPCSKKK